jgi:hypothetical protein
MNGTKRCWHLCSEELPDKLLFNSLDDFRIGMNSIPVALQGTSVDIYCFTLMNNHFHFLIGGAQREVLKFFARFKTRLGRMLTKGPSQLEGVRPYLVEVTSGEMFRTEVAYILRNCLKAGISNPYTYPWNTCRLYFRDRIFDAKPENLEGKTEREIRAMLSISRRMPSKYVTSNGFILPESYVNVKEVERIFGTSVNFFMKLRDWKVEQDSAEAEKRGTGTMYDDVTLLAKLDLEFKRYGVSGFGDMDEQLRRIFARILRNKYGSNLKQVCRLTGLDTETARRVIGLR